MNLSSVFSTITLILLSIGCAQGIFFGLQLFWTRTYPSKNKFLACLLLLFSYRLFNQILLYFGIGKYDWWYHSTLDLSWAYGALIFLYIKASSSISYQFSKKDQLLFIPVALQIIMGLFVRSQNFFWDGTRESLSWLGYWGYVLWMNYSTVPFIASVFILFHLKKAKTSLSAIDLAQRNPEPYRFIEKLLINTQRFYILVVAIYLVDFLLIRFIHQEAYYYFNRFYYNPFLIGISILTYVLSFVGYKQRKSLLIRPKPQYPTRNQKTLEEIAERLDLLMRTQQVFKNPNLSLDDLAKLLDTKTHLLSQTLKYIHDTSFYPFLTKYRVEEFRSLLLDPEHRHLSLLGLAYEAGFNSKSSFHRAIKKHYQLTPSEFKKQVLQEIREE